jgi:hypothetical protein
MKAAPLGPLAHWGGSPAQDACAGLAVRGGQGLEDDAAADQDPDCPRLPLNVLHKRGRRRRQVVSAGGPGCGRESPMPRFRPRNAPIGCANRPTAALGSRTRPVASLRISTVSLSVGTRSSESLPRLPSSRLPIEAETLNAGVAPLCTTAETPPRRWGLCAELPVAVSSDWAHVFGLGALLALSDLELHPLVLVQ